MSDLVGTPEDQFYRFPAHFKFLPLSIQGHYSPTCLKQAAKGNTKIACLRQGLLNRGYVLTLGWAS